MTKNVIYWIFAACVSTDSARIGTSAAPVIRLIGAFRAEAGVGVREANAWAGPRSSSGSGPTCRYTRESSGIETERRFLDRRAGGK